jgi:methionyl-tRNA formyltransferase
MNVPFVYFGGEPIGVPVLEQLAAAGLTPSLIIASPDKPVGRKQVMTQPPVAAWAEAHDIPCLQPATYKTPEAKADLTSALEAVHAQVFVVVAYNYIVPSWLLAIPALGTLNVHPSLLPLLRGASPIRSAILRDQPEALGVSVMLLDEEMDHGPILAQQAYTPPEWPSPGPHLDTELGEIGGRLLATTLPSFIAGKIHPAPQDHAAATYCSKLSRADAEIALDPHDLPTGTGAWDAWLKVNAYAGMGDTFFMHEGERIKLKEAQYTGSVLCPLVVVPAGRKPVTFTDWLASLR